MYIVAILDDLYVDVSKIIRLIHFKLSKHIKTSKSNTDDIALYMLLVFLYLKHMYFLLKPYQKSLSE